jgi:DMSO reductase anchor subunit
MKPALSIVLFTTLAGIGQGLAVALAVAALFGAVPGGAFAPAALWVATGLMLLALVASFFHLGRPARAWRAALMWRTSWMSREVIVLPVFIGCVAAWAYCATFGAGGGWFLSGLIWAVLVLAFLLWYCTAMVYVCIRFIQEWAHPLTVVNFTMLGLASGLVAACALAALMGEGRFAAAMAGWAVGATAIAWFTRGLSLRRNARLQPVSTTQSATGIRASRVVQTSMGMTGGSFNTREFFHGASMRALRHARRLLVALTFAAPLLALAAGLILKWPGGFVLALLLQCAGLLIERWFFFAQARHPQNIYYQVVS